MAEDDAIPSTDGDITPPPATTEFQPAAPLKVAGVEFEAEEGGTIDNGSKTDQAKAAIKDGATRLSGQATDRLRAYAVDGKAKAGTALDQLSQLLTDAAGQVDEKLGQQYGGYARQAAGAVQNFSSTLQEKDVDELFEDARELVRKSPGVAIGAAAAVGFVVARLVHSGLDSNKT